MFQTQKGLGNPYGDDTIDIKVLLRKILSKWYYFAIGGILAVGFAFYKIQTTPPTYRVKARAILGNPNEEGRNDAEILNSEIFQDQSDMEDKIGVITSYNLIREAAARLPVGISYRGEDGLKTLELFRQAPFHVDVDSTHDQLVGIRYYVTRVGQTLRIRGEAEEAWVYDIEEGRGIRPIKDFAFEKTVEASGEIDSEDFEDFFEVEDDLFKFTISYKKSWATYPEYNYFFNINTLDGLTGSFQGALSVEAEGEESSIIKLSMEGPVVEIQQLFLTELLESYRRKEQREIQELGNATIAFLDSQINALSGDISQTQSEIRRRMSQGGTTDPTASDLANQKELTALNTQYGGLQARLNYYQNVYGRLQNSDASSPIELASPSGFPDPVLAELISSLNQLQQERLQLELTNTKGPKWELNEIQIRNVRNSIFANVESSIESLEIQTSTTLNQINEIRRKNNMMPMIRADLEILSADKSIQDKQKISLINRRNEALMSLINTKVNIEVLESPRMEGHGPVAPSKFMILLLCLVAGMGLPLGVILVQDYLDNRIASHDDIQSSTNMPVLGFIARHDRNSNYIVPKDSRTALAESFRSIRIKMQYLNDNVHQQMIGVTSSSSGEGKTFCVTNMAAVFAHAGKRTLLIDIDLRRPRVTRYFENKDGLGLSNYLSGEVDDPMGIVQETYIENLDVLHSGPVASNPLDLIATDRMTQLMEIYREEYDHIVLDTPPVGLVSDYLVIMKLTDFNIYVIRDSATTVESLKMINELYDSQKIKNIAMLINDVKSVSHYGYIDKHYGYGD